MDLSALRQWLPHTRALLTLSLIDSIAAIVDQTGISSTSDSVDESLRTDTSSRVSLLRVDDQERQWEATCRLARGTHLTTSAGTPASRKSHESAPSWAVAGWAVAT